MNVMRSSQEDERNPHEHETGEVEHRQAVFGDSIMGNELRHEEQRHSGETE